ncbi:MAG TPA: diadenylate cyclase CdaA [Chthoniobacteraceae bacterium]|nr:diadenylate cyclase CdaA [Chthoniobacteraceae bacterium]
MTFSDFRTFADEHWADAVEIALLTIANYYIWKLFKGTRGSNVLAGLVTLFLVVTLASQLLGLPVITWIATRLSAVLIVALLIIFQPELRRGLALLGSHRLLFPVRKTAPVEDQLTEITFELSNRQLGALLAVERGQNIESFAQSGVPVDAALSPELIVSIFFPKTPLHDGGLIIRNDRIVSAACIFPVSQQGDLDRSLGLRHRAALGLAEESDAVVIVVSEETGIVSICHGGRIERNFDPETFRARLGALLASSHEESDSEQLAGKVRVAGARHRVVGGDQEEHRDNPLAF